MSQSAYPRYSPLPGADDVSDAVRDYTRSHDALDTAARLRRSVSGGVGRILLFLTLCLAAIVATDLLVQIGLRRVRTSTFGVFNRVVDGEVNAAILVSGSSRALNHFDPRVIQERTGLSTFNIGINGSQTDMQLAVFKTYLKHNAKPALLVQSLDSFTFVMSHGNVYFPGQYLPYLREGSIYHALTTINANIWKARYLPLYGYAVEDMNFTWMTGLRGMVGWSPPETRYLGYEPRDGAWNGDFERFKKTKSASVHFDIEPGGLRVLEELMALCRQRSIPVLLVYSPVYIEMQSLESNSADVFRHFRDIADRYDASLWDYRTSPICLNKGYFKNSEHLNATGATAFSAEFGSALAASGIVPSTRKFATARP